MKIKALFFALVCALALNFAILPDNAEANDFTISRDIKHKNGVREVAAQCKGAKKRNFRLWRYPDRGWILEDFGGANQYDAAEKYAQRHGGGNPNQIANIYCARIQAIR